MDINKNKNIILLGTYNGENYIREQIWSIQKQTVKEWELLIRDDGSSDNTVKILDELVQNDPRIKRSSGIKANLGVVGNYNQLMKTALKKDADIVFFCDQDDVWLPDKMMNQLEQIQKLEAKYGKKCPILVHTDLTVVDHKLNSVHKSFLDYQSIKVEKNSPLKALLTQNFVTGCTIAMNSSLLKMAVPIPNTAQIHDWWLALCASTFGKIVLIKKPMVLYRQHSDNNIGAKKLLHKFDPSINGIKTHFYTGRYNFVKSLNQAHSLKKTIYDKKINISEDILKLIETYSTCLEFGRFERLKNIFKSRIHRIGKLRQIFFYFLLFSSKKLSN